jgi:hypothetical protein
MTEQILLTTGDKITAVIDKPFFVSQGMVNSALEAMGFAEISWTEGPDSNDTLHGVYQGPTKSYDKPSQIVSYNIEHAASNVPATPATTGPVAPQAPVVVPAAPEVLPPADPKEAMAKAAKELLQGPGIGYALLLDMGFVLLMRHFWKGRKKADHGRR